MRSGERKAGKGAMATARFKPLVMTTSGSASASSTPQMLQPKITALFGATPRTVPKVLGAMGQRSSYLPSSQSSGQGYSTAFVPMQTPPPQEPAGSWAANPHNDYFPGSLAAQSAPESREVDSELPDGQRAAAESSLISPRRKSKLSLNHTMRTPERREQSVLSRVCNDGPAASSSNSSSEGNRADRAKKLCRASEQDRRVRLREEEDIRILARWEQEDQMVTLCTSRVPLDVGRHESQGLSGAGSVGNEHSQHGTGSHSPLLAISADADCQDAIPARSRMERKELPSTQRVPDVIELLDSSQDVEGFGDGANVRGMVAGGNEDEDDDWGEDWEEDGVVIEAPPDDEDLGEFARPRTPVGMSTGFDPSLRFASNLGQHADGEEDEEDEEFQRLLRKRGGLLPEPTVGAQESVRRVRERNGDVDIDSTRESHDEEEEDDLGKEDRKGSGSRGSRIGFWMTERFGPQKHQYKRVYVDGNGRKHSGKAAFSAAKQDGKEPGKKRAQKKKGGGRKGRERTGLNTKRRSKASSSQKASQSNATLSNRKGSEGRGGKGQGGSMRGKPASMSAHAPAVHLNKGKREGSFSARAAAMVASATAGDRTAANRGGSAGVSGAGGGIRAMFQTLA